MSDDDEAHGPAAPHRQRSTPLPRSWRTWPERRSSPAGSTSRLADLVRDSDRDTLGVRGAEPRLLTFALGEITLEYAGDGGRRPALRRRSCSPAPRTLGAGLEVQVETPAATAAVDADEQGWFRVDGLAAGPVRVRIRASDGADNLDGLDRALTVASPRGGRGPLSRQGGDRGRVGAGRPSARRTRGVEVRHRDRPREQARPPPRCPCTRARGRSGRGDPRPRRH